MSKYCIAILCCLAVLAASCDDSGKPAAREAPKPAAKKAEKPDKAPAKAKAPAQAKPKPKLEIQFAIGPYRFKVDLKVYTGWVNALYTQFGNDHEAVLADLERRLGLDAV